MHSLKQWVIQANQCFSEYSFSGQGSMEVQQDTWTETTILYSLYSLQSSWYPGNYTVLILEIFIKFYFC